jgi:hypothetical protein
MVKSVETPQPIEEKVQTKTIMNRGTRAFHVKPESIIKGGELSWDKKYACINPGMTAEVDKEIGDRMIKIYPSEIIDVSKGK